MKTKLLFIFLLLMQCKIFAQTISKQNLEIVCREQNCSIQKADSILRNCAYIYFDTLVHDFGTIPEGSKPEYEFAFMNIGRKDLIMSGSQFSGGGFLSQWDKQPIKPDQRRVYFNSSGRQGSFSKVAWVSSNAFNSNHHLLIKGFIKKTG